jgi:hypothetical protein
MIITTLLLPLGHIPFMMIEETWIQPHLAYMINKALHEDTVKARRIIRQSKAFIVLQEKLYKKKL